MNDAIEVQAVMTQFPHSIGWDQTVQVAREMMHEHGIRHLPVQKGGVLIGILSDRDINFALAVDKNTEVVLVDSVYTPDPYRVQPETPLLQVAEQMAREGIGCALVVENEQLRGIFTTVDACRILGELLRRNPGGIL